MAVTASNQIAELRHSANCISEDFTV